MSDDATYKADAVVGISVLREKRAAERIVRLLSGEITTYHQLGGHSPEGVLCASGMEVEDVFPRERTQWIRRGGLRVEIADTVPGSFKLSIRKVGPE